LPFSFLSFKIESLAENHHQRDTHSYASQVGCNKEEVFNFFHFVLLSIIGHTASGIEFFFVKPGIQFVCYLSHGYRSH
jgi:hypothetical protein